MRRLLQDLDHQPYPKPKQENNGPGASRARQEKVLTSAMSKFRVGFRV